MKTEEEIQQLFEQVKHLIESDEPIDNPYEVQPHSFSEAEHSSLLDVFPDNVSDDDADDFLQRLALAIGTFHRLNNPKEQPLANSKARKKLKSLRNAFARSHKLYVRLPDQLHRGIDIALQQVEHERRIEQGGEPSAFVWNPGAHYSDATADSVYALVNQMSDMVKALDLRENYLKQNRGGNPVGVAMSDLSLKTAIAFKKCFGLDPTSTAEDPFELILAVAAEITGSRGASEPSVMHYVRKAIQALGQLDDQNLPY